MRNYTSVISLTKNSRGIYCLDTSMGCSSGMSNEIGGCYNDCYAAKSAKTYGYDFSKTILRNIENKYHRRFLLNQINKVKLDFIRIGCSGDPSENWDHCISIIKQIENCNKQIVIITRHWTLLSDEQLEYFNRINICVNTSISALDKPEIFNKCIEQYHRIKPFCKSILRIVSCEFNLNNKEGHRLAKLQSELFKNEAALDTIFRPSKNNSLVIDEIINTKKIKFNGNIQLASKYNKKTFSGKCANCQEMCGLNIKSKSFIHENKKPIFKQLILI